MSRFLLFAALLWLPQMVHARSVEVDFDTIFSTIGDDYKNFYVKDTGTRAALIFGAGAIMAHSNIDTEFQRWYKSDIHSDFTDDTARIAKLFGEKMLMLPISGLAASYQIKEQDSVLAKWGQLTFRSYLVGGPVIGVTQPLTGGSRPRDEYQDAKWRPFNDDNGVSGHSFVGAVPFIVLSRLDGLTERQRSLALIASGLSAWSRVNDDAHYLSQAILGWYVAWESVNAVTKTGMNDNWYTVSPKFFGDGIGLNFAVNW